MAARMRSRMRGELVPRELAPAYERLAAQPRVRELLEELKRINAGDSTRKLGGDVYREPPLIHYLNKGELNRFIEYANAEAKSKGTYETKRLLQAFGRAVYKGLQSEMKSYSSSKKEDPGFARFKEKFGHEPANLKQGSADALGCASHAIAQALLAEHAGLKVGILDLPRHALPVVKLEGKNFVLERNLYNQPNTLTVREYARELEKAHSKKGHPLHRIARASFSEGKPKMSDFASKMKYYGGSKAGDAVIHLNLGEHYFERNEVSNARKHFEASIDAFPMPLARSRLASVFKKQGHPILALKQALAAHELAPNDVNNLLQARGIAGGMGWTRRAKELNDNAYELIRKKKQ